MRLRGKGVLLALAPVRAKSEKQYWKTSDFVRSSRPITRVHSTLPSFESGNHLNATRSGQRRQSNLNPSG